MVLRPPPAKPFAIVALTCFGVLVLWGIVGRIVEPAVAGDVVMHRRIGRIVVLGAFALVVTIGFSLVPVMAHVFSRLFFGLQKVGGREQAAAILKLRENWTVRTAIHVYGAWIVLALGLAAGGPLFVETVNRDMGALP